MRKRMRLAQNMGDRRDLNSNDFISRLPDEVLVSILSSFPLKAAAATSLLSRRWRYVWCQNVRLDFEDDKRLSNMAVEPKLRLLQRNKYINWVNRVIRQNKSSMIEEFKICFDLDKYCKGAISKWIEFAISKNVQNLELDLMDKSEMRSDHVGNFVFPNKILDRKSRSSLKRQSNFSLPCVPPTTAIEIKFLKVLTLKCVNINDEGIRKILMSCLVLQHLSIYESGQIVNVKISGPKLALTNLEIVFCSELVSIEICNSNLAYFRYSGPPINLILDEVPNLKRISIGQGPYGIDDNSFQQISCCRRYLEVLELNLDVPKRNILSIYEFPNVKQLILNVGAWEDHCLLWLTLLVRACPNLLKFVIQLIWMPTVERTMRIRRAVTHPHQHLEVVEIRGFYGRISDFELALHFIENGIALKKMVIDPHDQFMKRTPINETLEEKKSRFRAQKLLPPRMPPGVELVIL